MSYSAAARFTLVVAIVLAAAAIAPRPVAAVGNWTSVDEMSTGRSTGATVLLSDGRVLVLGGSDNRSAEILNPSDGTWSSAGQMLRTRNEPTATRLTNGKVLVTGGFNNNLPFIRYSELYDPATNTWKSTGSLSIARANHTATLLPDGRVLVVGGRVAGGSYNYTDSAEIYDPATGRWSLTGTLAASRNDHAAVLLPNGKVLVVGGWAASSIGELWDPTSGEWESTGVTMTLDRFGPAATVLADGRVLVTGGGSYGNPRSTTEIYDPGTNRWTRTSNMAQDRSSHAAFLLTDGRVLVAGGVTEGGTTTLSEVFDPISEVWSATGSIWEPLEGISFATLSDGRPFIIGHSSIALIYEPVLNSPPWSNGPAPSLVRGSLGPNSAPSVPVRVHWWGDDPDGDGIASFRVQRSDNGGTFFNQLLASPLSTTMTKRLAIDPGPDADRYQFRVRATDTLGAVGDYSYWREFSLDAVQQDDPNVYPSGTWTPATLTGAYGNSVLKSYTDGSFVGYSFYGPSVGWVTTMGPDRGVAEVWVDGTIRAIVDLQTSTVRKRQIAFVQNDLDGLQHSMVIRVVKTASGVAKRVDVDGFVTITPTDTSGLVVFDTNVEGAFVCVFDDATTPTPNCDEAVIFGGTDEFGDMGFAVNAGRYVAQISADGYETTLVSFTLGIGDYQVIEVELQAAAPVP